MDLITRFDGTEQDAFTMAMKLTKYNEIAKDHLIALIVEKGSIVAKKYMIKLDKLGLCDGRINLLFNACANNYDIFYKVIDKLCEIIDIKFIQDLVQTRFTEMVDQKEYDELVKELMS